MTAREKEQIDRHITGNFGEDQEVDDAVNENLEASLDQADLDQLLRAARAKAEKEHMAVQDEIIKLEDRLKVLHDRDSELSQVCNRLADAMGSRTPPSRPLTRTRARRSWIFGRGAIPRLSGTRSSTTCRTRPVGLRPGTFAKGLPE